MRIDLFLHHFTRQPQYDEILRRLAALHTQGARIMALVDQLRAQLVAANEATNEIATDVQDLLNRATAPGISAEDAEALTTEATALVERLRAVAAEHTPPTTQP